MRRVVVTGATGGLGHRACEMLLEQGIEVVATGRDEAKALDLVDQGARFHALDLARCSVQEIARIARGSDALWHCAALSSPWGSAQAFEQANVRATRQVASAALAADVPRLVHISTPAVYFDFQDHFGVTEAYVPRQFANHYARSKYAAEQVVQELVRGSQGRLSAAILRPRALFGPGDQVLVPRLLSMARAKGGTLALPRGGRVTLDLTYLDNVVEAMRRATLVPLGGARVFNVSNGEPVELATALQSLFALLRQQGVDEGWRIRPVPYAVVDLVARAMELAACLSGNEPALTRYSAGVMAYSMTLDISRVRQELDFAPLVSVQEGLLRTAHALARKLR